MRAATLVLAACVCDASSLSASPSPRSALLPNDAVAVARQIFALDPAPHVALFVAGGGTQLAPWLLATPGASACVVDLQVPYSRAALAQLLGEAPERFCCPLVARQLAAAAFARARELHESTTPGATPRPCVGLGCTAALVSSEPRRGSHRCFVAVCTERGVHELSVELTKGARDRQHEDAVVSRCAMLGLAAACGVELPDDGFLRASREADLAAEEAGAPVAPVGSLMPAETVVRTFTEHS